MMSAGSYTFVDLLSSSKNLDALLEPRVATISHRLGLHVDDVVIAGACLGSSTEAIDRLIAASVLPEELPEEQREELSRFLNVEIDDLKQAVARNREKTLNFLGLAAPYRDPPTPLPTIADPVYPLFPHQRRALQEIFALLEKGHNRIVLHMPTGSGKTRTAMNLICDHLRRSDRGAILWLASTQELLEQAAHEFARAWGHLGNRKVPIFSAWGGRKWEPERIQDGVVVASPQTLNALLKSSGPKTISDLGSNLQLIVFDEAHQAIAPTFREVAERLAASAQPITPVVGLTATPGRTFTGDGNDDELADFFHHTKVTLDTSAEGGPTNPVDYLITHGYLAKPDFVLLGELPAEEPHYFNRDEYDLGEEVDLGLAVDEYLSLVASSTIDLVQEGHTRIIVFAASVDLARILASILRAANIDAHSIDANTEAAVRDSVIRNYKTRTRDARVLVNYGVLTTGFDAPQTSAAVIARPTRSLVLYSQMVGRAIRGPRAGGNDKAKVVTVIDPTVPAFGSVAEAFEHWNTYWEQ